MSCISIEERCPYCQMPLNLLKVQNVNLHFEECSRRKNSSGNLKECPRGVKCDSTMICHYNRYSHQVLAQFRASANSSQKNVSSQDGDLKTNTNLSMITLDLENQCCTSDDFESGHFLISKKKQRKHPNSRNASFKDSSSVDLLREINNPSTDVFEGANKSPNNVNHSLSNVTHHLGADKPDSEVVQSTRRSPLSFCNDVSDTQEFLDCNMTETDFKSTKFNSTSSQVICDENSNKTSLNTNHFYNHQKCTATSSPNVASVDNILKRKRKQADIRTLLFGLKPLTPEVLPVEPLPVVTAKTATGSHYWNKKTCPFYKKIQGTDIAVDAFSYGIIPGINYYFLSHFHYDHYMGLTKKFAADIYCSHVTGNLLESRIGIAISKIKRLPLNQKVQVGNVLVTLLEANHCPGAVLLLFQLKNNSRILHTGDFRADTDVQKNTFILEDHIDTIYLDTTYLDPTYKFPAQYEVVEFVANIVERAVKLNRKTLVVTGTYCIGKEKIFMGISKRLQIEVCVAKDKAKVLKCLDDQDINSVATTDPSRTRLHVLPMNKLNPSSLRDYLQKFDKVYDCVIAIKPTGWTFKGASTCLNDIKPSVCGPVIIYGVPYSEHSSFNELKEFIELLKPRHVIPTVNVGKAESRKRMESYLQCWKKK